MSQNPPDQPELPKPPSMQSGDFDPIPADPQPSDPDPEPFEPEPSPLDPAAETPGVAPGDADGSTPGAPPPPAQSAGGGGGGSKLPLILGGIVALALVGGAALFLTRDEGSSSPEDTVRDYFEATQDRDCDKLVELVNEDVWSKDGKVDRDEAIDQCTVEVKETEDMKMTLDEVETVSEKDGKATVKADVTIDGDKGSVEIDLVKVDGDWKIDEF